MSKIPSLPVLASVLLLAPVLPAPAQVNLALNHPVIYSSSDFNASYAASHVTDGSTSDANAQIGQAPNYWITANGAGVGARFILDLGATFQVGELDLRNTANGNYGDRGTQGFTINASTLVSGNTLVSPQRILIGSLTDYHTLGANTTIPADRFTSVNGLTTGNFRYLEFVVNSLPGYAANQSAGLNEFEVYSSVIPEPSAVLLLGGGLLGTVVFFLRRKASARGFRPSE